MPSITLPVLAIKEANDHLQALFIENQRLDSQVEKLSGILKQTQDENVTLGEYVKAVNERVLSLGEEHIESVRNLRESLNTENNKQLSRLRELLNIENNKQLSDLKEVYQKSLKEQEELAKSEQEKLLNDLEVKLKLQETKKMNELQKIIEGERIKVSMLENKIRKLNGYLVRNTSKREEKIALLNNVFKSTIENMSWCLSVASEQDFIRSDSLVFENYSIHDDKDDSEAFSNDNNYSNIVLQNENIHNSDSGIHDNGNNIQDHQTEEDRLGGVLDVNFSGNSNDLQNEKKLYVDGNDMQNEKNELKNHIQIMPNAVQNNSNSQNYFASHNGEGV